MHVLNSFCSTDWLKTSDIVSSRSTLHYITLHYITLHYITLHYITLLTFLHFGAFVRFFPHIQIFSRLYNLPPRQAFWSSRRPDSLAITLHYTTLHCIARLNAFSRRRGNMTKGNFIWPDLWHSLMLDYRKQYIYFNISWSTT